MLSSLVCQDRQEAVKRIQSGFEDDPTAYEKAVTDELSRLKKLKPPEDAKDDWSRLLTLYEDSIESELRAAKVYADRDASNDERATASEDYTRANRSGAQARKIAKRLGTGTCGEHVY